jgi:hypothetical protein
VTVWRAGGPERVVHEAASGTRTLSAASAIKLKRRGRGGTERA